MERPTTDGRLRETGCYDIDAGGAEHTPRLTLRGGTTTGYFFSAAGGGAGVGVSGFAGFAFEGTAGLISVFGSGGTEMGGVVTLIG